MTNIQSALFRPIILHLLTIIVIFIYAQVIAKRFHMLYCVRSVSTFDIDIISAFLNCKSITSCVVDRSQLTKQQTYLDYASAFTDYVNCNFIAQILILTTVTLICVETERRVWMNSKDFHVCVQTVSMGYSANQVRGNSKDIEGRIYVFNEESTLIEIVIVLDVS